MKRISIFIFISIFLISVMSYAGPIITGGGGGIDPASPGPIGGTTPAAGTFTTLTVNDTANLGSNVSITGGNIDVTTANVDGTLTVAGVANVIGNFNVGTSTAGANITVSSTLGSELVPALNAGNWDVAAGWDLSSNTLKHTAGNTTAISPVTDIVPTVNSTYKITYTVANCDGNGFLAEFGGYYFGYESSSYTYPRTVTTYVTATSNADLIITPYSANFDITSISIKQVGAGGTITADSDLIVGGQIVLSHGAPNTAAIIFMDKNNKQTGLYMDRGTMGFSYSNLGEIISFDNEFFRISGVFGWHTNTSQALVNPSAGVIAQQSGTTAQEFRVVGTTDTGAFYPEVGTNYEYFSIKENAGSNVTLSMQTGGTGADNLDIVITPAGTGQIKIPQGSLAKPALTFTADTDTGIYQTDLGYIRMAGNGSCVAEIGDGKIAACGNGTATIPAFGFSSDGNLGLYRIGADILGVTANGSEVARFDTTGIKVTGASTVKGTSGGYKRISHEALSGAMSGSSVTITMGIPANARLLGVQLKVKDVVTCDEVCTWGASFAGGSTTSIATGLALAANTASNIFLAAENTTTGANIIITPSAGNITAGNIQAVVYTEEFDAL